MRGKVRLMHKDDLVCIMQLNNNNQVIDVLEIANEKLLPPSISLDSDRDIRIELTRWLRGRIFSPGRLDIMEIQSFLSKDGLSLAGRVSFFDCYWLSSKTTEKWDEVNPYKNWQFKTDPISLLNMKPEYFNKSRKIDSPNLSIPGREIRLFYKNNKNEVFLLSQNVIKEMSFYKKNIDNPIVAKRKYIALSGKLFTAKKMVTDENTEIFPLSDLLIKTEGFEEIGVNRILHCMSVCGIGRQKAALFLKNLIEADGNIENNDREPDSIYLLRDANTLEFIGIAPV